VSSHAPKVATIRHERIPCSQRGSNAGLRISTETRHTTITAKREGKRKEGEWALVYIPLQETQVTNAFRSCIPGIPHRRCDFCFHNRESPL